MRIIWQNDDERAFEARIQRLSEHVSKPIAHHTDEHQRVYVNDHQQHTIATRLLEERLRASPTLRSMSTSMERISMQSPPWYNGAQTQPTQEARASANN
jgi:hypothetical protein